MFRFIKYYLKRDSFVDLNSIDLDSFLLFYMPLLMIGINKLNKNSSWFSRIKFYLFCIFTYIFLSLIGLVLIVFDYFKTYKLNKKDKKWRTIVKHSQMMSITQLI